MHEITDLLVRVSQGESNALDHLIPEVYEDLRRIARSHMTRERGDHTLSATALVNETYVHLAAQQRMICHNRREFFALASTLMRRVLVDHARRHLAAKRGGGQPAIALDSNVGRPVTLEELITINEAITDLGKRNPRLPIVVDLMFFGGFTHQEIADVLRVSVATVTRDWAMSKAFLSNRLAQAF